MRDYLLFIDTEASGLPKKWDAPYSQKGNWPYAVQISWIIYTKGGHQVKQENHYINDNDFEITPAAFKIHNINRAFLLAQGNSRQDVLRLLVADIRQYQPLVIGHFMEFDGHVLAADFYRASLEDLISSSPTFCTMLATTGYVHNPWLKFLRLGDLYRLLFNTTLENQHNALVDARATAECFFELVKRGEIDDEKIAQQQLEKQIKANAKIKELDSAGNKLGCSIPAFVLFIITVLICNWL